MTTTIALTPRLLLRSYLVTCFHAEPRALARLPDGRACCFWCYLAAWMAYRAAVKEEETT